MTTLTDTQVITASGGLVELGYNSRTTGISIDGTSWGSATIINPNTAVVCDGSPVVVEFSCGQVEISSGSQVQFALFRDGSAIAYNLAWYTNSGSSSNEYQPVSFFFRDTPTAGSHTYSVRAIKPPGTFVYLYASNGSSQSDGGPATMRVSKIVQATQWPAVTTGTIICTSSTRPASPFEGQRIYETDTDLSWTWSGSAWVSPSLAFKPPSVRCLATGTSQTLPTGALTAINFPAEEYDTNSMHSTISNTSRVTVPYTGLYLVNSYVTTGAAGGNRYIYILKNGGQWMFKAAVVDPTNSASAGIVDSICAVVPCAANDYIESGVFHNTGSSIAVGAGSWLSVSWYGQYL